MISWVKKTELKFARMMMTVKLLLLLLLLTFISVCKAKRHQRDHINALFDIVIKSAAREREVPRFHLFRDSNHQFSMSGSVLTRMWSQRQEICMLKWSHFDFVIRFHFWCCSKRRVLEAYDAWWCLRLHLVIISDRFYFVSEVVLRINNFKWLHMNFARIFASAIS